MALTVFPFITVPSWREPRISCLTVVIWVCLDAPWGGANPAISRVCRSRAFSPARSAFFGTQRKNVVDRPTEGGRLAELNGQGGNFDQISLRGSD